MMKTLEKNNIAVSVLDYVRCNYSNVELAAVTNNVKACVDLWQSLLCIFSRSEEEYECICAS